MNTWRSFFIIILLLAISAGLYFGLTQINSGGSSYPAGLPKKLRDRYAPDFELELMDGTIYRMSEHVGSEVVILNFFATWCGPCKEEMPEFERFSNDNSDKPVRLIGVDANEKRNLVEPFIKEFGISFSVGIDYLYTLHGLYDVNYYPTTIIIGVDGKVWLYRVGSIADVDESFGSIIKENLDNLKQGKVISKKEFLSGRIVDSGDAGGEDQVKK